MPLLCRTGAGVGVAAGAAERHGRFGALPICDQWTFKVQPNTRRQLPALSTQDDDFGAATKLGYCEYVASSSGASKAAFIQFLDREANCISFRSSDSVRRSGCPAPSSSEGGAPVATPAPVFPGPTQSGDQLNEASTATSRVVGGTGGFLVVIGALLVSTTLLK